MANLNRQVDAARAGIESEALRKGGPWSYTPEAMDSMLLDWFSR